MLLHRLLTHQVEALAPTSLPVSKDVCVVRLAALQVAAIQDPFLGRVGGCFAHRLLTLSPRSLFLTENALMLTLCSHLLYRQRMLMATGILSIV